MAPPYTCSLVSPAHRVLHPHTACGGGAPPAPACAGPAKASVSARHPKGARQGGLAAHGRTLAARKKILQPVRAAAGPHVLGARHILSTSPELDDTWGILAASAALESGPCLPRSMPRPSMRPRQPHACTQPGAERFGPGCLRAQSPGTDKERAKNSNASPMAAGRPDAPAERGRGRAGVRQDGQGRGRSDAQPAAGTGEGQAPSSSWLGRAPLAGLGPGAPAERWNGPRRQTGVGQTVNPRPGRGLERPQGASPAWQALRAQTLCCAGSQHGRGLEGPQAPAERGEDAQLQV